MYGFHKIQTTLNNIPQNTSHKHIGITLPRLKIDLKNLNTHLELKISKTTSFSSDSLTDCWLDGLPAVRPTSTRCMGPVFSTMNLLSLIIFKSGDK